MHEVAIMQSALDIALQQANASGAQSLHQLRLRVGSLSGAVPEALQFAFEALSQGTLAAGARLDIELVPAAYWCRRCAAEFEAESYAYECPRCHELSSELRRGRELELSSMEIS